MEARKRVSPPQLYSKTFFLSVPRRSASSSAGWPAGRVQTNALCSSLPQRHSGIVQRSWPVVSSASYNAQQTTMVYAQPPIQQRQDKRRLCFFGWIIAVVDADPCSGIVFLATALRLAASPAFCFLAGLFFPTPSRGRAFRERCLHAPRYACNSRSNRLGLYLGFSKPAFNDSATALRPYGL